MAAKKIKELKELKEINEINEEKEEEKDLIETEKFAIKIPLVEGIDPKKLIDVVPKILGLLVESDLNGEETFGVVDAILAYAAGRSECKLHTIGEYVLERCRIISGMLIDDDNNVSEHFH